MKISDAKTLLRETFLYNIHQMEAGKSHNTYLVPFFVGDPGVGKTAIPRQVATELAAENPELGISLHQTIVAQYDAGEMGGLPFLGKVEMEDGTVEDRMIQVRPNYMPDPKQANGVLGFWNLDEMPQAFLANLNICSQIINEWRVGEHNVSPGITICATGNKPENKAGTTSLPMHLRDRLMYIPIDTDHDEFLGYAATYALDYRVRAYIKKNPASLHKFQVGLNSFPSPRSWEKASGILSMDLPSHIRVEALSGQIGDGEATQFEAYIRIADRLPDPEDIIKDPMNAPIYGAAEADILYLILTNLADMAKESNVEQIIKYLRRLPNKEFLVLWSKDALARHPKLNNNKHVTEFKLKDIGELLS